MPTRAQLEIGLLVAGTMAILILYRNYLQRSLAIQEQQLRDLSGPSAYQNGGAPKFDPDLARRATAADRPPYTDA
jgi:hypothetical protein